MLSRQIVFAVAERLVVIIIAFVETGAIFHFEEVPTSCTADQSWIPWSPLRFNAAKVPNFVFTGPISVPMGMERSNATP